MICFAKSIGLKILSTIIKYMVNCQMEIKSYYLLAVDIFNVIHAVKDGVSLVVAAIIFAVIKQFFKWIRRNNIGFYTQGFNLVKGIHCTKCECCAGCCPQEILYLRENIDPESPDINVGIRKGYTANPLVSCDRETIYYNQNDSKGYGIRAKCCDILLHQCLCFNADFEIDIENDNGLKVGSIMIYSGCCSKAVEGTCCYLPRKYFEINTPIGATSEQKFQIIADAIHFDLANRVL